MEKFPCFGSFWICSMLSKIHLILYQWFTTAYIISFVLHACSTVQLRVCELFQSFWTKFRRFVLFGQTHCFIINLNFFYIFEGNTGFHAFEILWHSNYYWHSLCIMALLFDLQAPWSSSLKHLTRQVSVFFDNISKWVTFYVYIYYFMPLSVIFYLYFVAKSVTAESMLYTI